jgi:(p)ppGpp synthase/HD superfamily hydrolase
MKVVQAIAIDQLLDSLPDYYTTQDRDEVKRAYAVAAQAHAEQKRQSGEPYINHCVAVAAILSDLKMPPALASYMTPLKIHISPCKICRNNLVVLLPTW